MARKPFIAIADGSDLRTDPGGRAVGLRAEWIILPVVVRFVP